MMHPRTVLEDHDKLTLGRALDLRVQGGRSFLVQANVKRTHWSQKGQGEPSIGQL